MQNCGKGEGADRERVEMKRKRREKRRRKEEKKRRGIETDQGSGESESQDIGSFGVHAFQVTVFSFSNILQISFHKDLVLDDCDDVSLVVMKKECGFM